MPSINKQTPEFFGLLLAGGKSSRFEGEDKGLYPINGKPMALHVIERLQPQVNALAISCNRNNNRYEQLFKIAGGKSALAGHLACVGDSEKLPSAGPLGGIYAFLSRILTNESAHSLKVPRKANSLYLFVACCDMPSIPLDLVQTLYRAIQDTSHKAAYIATPTQPYFLPCLLEAHTAYSQLSALIKESQQHSRNFLSVKKLLERLNAATIDNQWREENFININSKADIT